MDRMHELTNGLVVFLSDILANGTNASDFNVCTLACFDDVLFH